jgi:hypothetical protein
LAFFIDTYPDTEIGHHKIATEIYNAIVDEYNAGDYASVRSRNRDFIDYVS